MTSPSLAIDSLCDFGTVLNPSEPQFPPLQKRVMPGDGDACLLGRLED